ncbi:antitoxin VapB [Rhizobium sp. BK650]|uniref:antitoxin n=1 Tax=Rhizobium sp. BK650 TaxID=2586990 RepID=UPI00160918A4|nr:antitoxin [Rhizobium sp. BK650]MBB3659339.1 antitoxin VapB [Rhizobium sp. BK650]
MAQFAKVFQSGNSQAVRLPKEFRFDVDELEITREGDAVILRPIASTKERWGFLRKALSRRFSEDFVQQERGQPDAEERPGLDELFR